MGWEGREGRRRGSWLRGTWRGAGEGGSRDAWIFWRRSVGEAPLKRALRKRDFADKYSLCS